MQSRISITLPWIIGAAVAAAILLSGLLLASDLRIQRRTADEIQTRFERVSGIRRAQSLLVDAETGQRGFLLTSKRSYLGPYERARTELPLLLARLRASHPAAPTEALDSASQAKLLELQKTVELAESGRRQAALAIVDSDSGKRYMDLARRETARLADAEQAQLDSALQRSDVYAVRTFWALAFLALSVALLVWLGVALFLRARSLEAEAARLREVEEAQKQTALVARELNHRVKNLFSVVIAIVQLASRGTATPQEAVTRIRERLHALALAHEVSLGSDPMGGFELASLLSAILAPYSEVADFEISGPPLQLPVMRATPLGLIVHELATNAMKYGAWSVDGGKVTIRWSIAEQAESSGERMLEFCWKEHRDEPLKGDGAAGFGSRLIHAAIAQLDGMVNREWGENGISIVIRAPIVPEQSAHD